MDGKMDPRLRRLLARIGEGEQERASLIPVIIEHRDRPEGKSLSELEADVRHKQQGILHYLQAIGVEGVSESDISILSNSLVARLTSDQVERVSELGDVKALRLSKSDWVTAEF